MTRRTKLSGQYDRVNDALLREKADRDDPRRVFYAAMFSCDTYEEYLAMVGQTLVDIPGYKNNPISGRDEILYCRRQGWIDDAATSNRSQDALTSYRMQPVATVRIDGDDFVIEWDEDDPLVRETMCIYAFLIGDEILRIGSSIKELRGRLMAWRRDVSKALKGQRSQTKPEEAATWREALTGKTGQVFARRGWVVETPIGEINACLAEESALIRRYRPRANNSRYR